MNPGSISIPEPGGTVGGVIVALGDCAMETVKAPVTNNVITAKANTKTVFLIYNHSIFQRDLELPNVAVVA